MKAAAGWQPKPVTHGIMPSRGRSGFQPAFPSPLNKKEQRVQPHGGNEHQLFWRPFARHLNVQDLLIKVDAGFFRGAGKDHIINQYFPVFRACFQPDGVQSLLLVAASPTGSITVLV